MDLARVPNEQKLGLCRTYFLVGFLLLPFVWTVNAIWFFHDAFLVPPYPEQKHIRKYVVLSMVGALVCAVALAAWISIYQMRRAEWGAFGDSLSFIIPVGRP